MALQFELTKLIQKQCLAVCETSILSNKIRALLDDVVREVASANTRSKTDIGTVLEESLLHWRVLLEEIGDKISAASIKHMHVLKGLLEKIEEEEEAEPKYKILTEIEEQEKNIYLNTPRKEAEQSLQKKTKEPVEVFFYSNENGILPKAAKPPKKKKKDKAEERSKQKKNKESKALHKKVEKGEAVFYNKETSLPELGNIVFEDESVFVVRKQSDQSEVKIDRALVRRIREHTAAGKEIKAGEKVFGRYEKDAFLREGVVLKPPSARTKLKKRDSRESYFISFGGISARPRAVPSKHVFRISDIPGGNADK
eukprot:GHVN01033654.1.p2 GENE.GHVN01033654.1~~GHVN01033654.1.p2  ORF type:complete len:312 (+),score=56.80 GHVN01033654.1:3-938(+)